MAPNACTVHSHNKLLFPTWINRPYHYVKLLLWEFELQYVLPQKLGVCKQIGQIVVFTLNPFDSDLATLD